MADEPGAAGGMSPDAIKAAQQAVSTMTSDFSKIEKSLERAARHLEKMSKHMQGMGGANLTGPGGFTTQSLNAGGTAPGQGISTGTISSSGSGLSARAMMGQLPGFLGKVGVSAVNDLRVTGEQALNYEFSQRRGAFGLGSTGEALKMFRPALESAIGKYNTANPNVMREQVATSFFSGHAAGFGGGQAGANAAAQNIGATATIASMIGMSPESVGTATSAISSGQAFNSLMSMGIQTRDASGKKLSNQNIAMQLYNKYYKGMTAEEITLAFEEGGADMYNLEQAVGADAANLIVGSMKLRAVTGQNVTEKNVDRLVKESELAGTPESAGLDAAAELGASQLKKEGSYKGAAAAGYAEASSEVASLNDGLTGLTGAARDAAEAVMALGGYLDGMQTAMPDTTGTVTNGLMNLAGSFLGSGLGGGGLRGGRAPRGTPSTGGGGMRGMRGMAGKAGLVGLGAAGLVGSQAVSDAWADPSKDWGVGNTLGNIGMKAASGAMMGSVLGLPGALVVGALGGVYGMYDSMRQESKDLEQNPGYAKGDWFVEKDQDARIHSGEMILPSRIAQSVRDELDRGKRSPGGGGNVTINLSIQNASEAEAQKFARKVKSIMDEDDELMAIGPGGLR